MPPKMSAKKQRIRVTNKAMESQRFSTVRLPRQSEVRAQRANIDEMFNTVKDPAENTPSSSSSSHTTPHSHSATNSKSEGMSQAPFDPIPNDPVFVVVQRSKYWPPPSLEEVQTENGALVGDGFDTYDRREDDNKARAARTKVVRGELNHPRGKERKNTLTMFDDSDKGSEDASDE